MILSPLKLDNVSKAIGQAFDYMKSSIGNYTMTPDELHNIQLSIDDYAKLIGDPTFMFKCSLLAAEDYDEVFRSKDIQDENVRELSTYYDNANIEYRKLLAKQMQQK